MAISRQRGTDLLARRLHNQRLTGSGFGRPEEVVAWMGAVQSQDYTGAKWALGNRAPRITDADVDRAFDDGKILRTHVLRRTWHFVPRADIRWMLGLTGARLIALTAPAYRAYELDDRTLSRCRSVFGRALRDGAQLTRTELTARLARAGVEARGVRLGHVLMRFELESLICSGARRNADFTYTLLDDRAPGAKPLPREEALAMLAERFFRSHGPATAHDFAWWSGLNVTEAQTGAALAGASLDKEVLDGRPHWFVDGKTTKNPVRAHLLPNWDEYFIAYKNREHILAGKRLEALSPDQYGNLVLLDGLVSGTWKRTLTTNGAALTTRLVTRTSRSDAAAVAAAVDRYGAFLGRAVTVK
jgi:hypothetical protein